MTLPRIFVHIPSYRDRECQWTVRDLFAKARHPERVFVGICWQTVPDQDADCFIVEACPAQVRTLHFTIAEAQGLGWARMQAQSLWQGEEYSLQIDSHMRFVADWDVAMIEMLAECDAADPVLTVYPPAYTPPDELAESDRPAVQHIKSFLPNGLLDFACSTVPEAAAGPMPTAACAGGFIFGPARILADVPADPEIYFNGEEPNLAVRLWTAGFDLFSPSRTLLYHYYGRKESSRHWDDAAIWSDRQARTLKRMQALCHPDACPAAEVAALGRYGLGGRRSLAGWQAFAGVDFAARTIADYARVYPFVRQPGDQDATLPEDDLVLAAGVRLFLVEDEGLLFREDIGEFYRLNASVVFVWCGREEGYSWARIADAQAAARGVAAETARGELAVLAAHWLGQGLLHRPGELPGAVPGSRRQGPRFDCSFITHDYALLGVAMRVRYSDADLERRVHPVIAHLQAAAGVPAHVFTVARILDYFYLFRDDTLLHCGENPAALAPPLKFQFLDSAIARQQPILQLHAGAVEWKGCLVLLPGQSGDGKTSLTARLVAAGATYFSDEAVLLERGGMRIRPIPIGICVKTRGLAVLAPYFADLAALPEHDREDGFKVRYLPPPEAALPPPGHTAEARVVVFRRYVPGAASSLRPLTRAETFGRLMDHCVAIPTQLTLQDAKALVGFIQKIDAYELTGGDLDEHARIVLSLCDEYSPL